MNIKNRAVVNTDTGEEIRKIDGGEIIFNPNKNKIKYDERYIDELRKQPINQLTAKELQTLMYKDTKDPCKFFMKDFKCFDYERFSDLSKKISPTDLGRVMILLTRLRSNGKISITHKSSVDKFTDFGLIPELDLKSRPNIIRFKNLLIEHDIVREISITVSNKNIKPLNYIILNPLYCQYGFNLSYLTFYAFSDIIKLSDLEIEYLKRVFSGDTVGLF